MRYSRRQFLLLAMMSGLVVGGIYATSLAKDALPAGTILVSLNVDPRENTSLGYWNHVAIMVNSVELVEAQECCGVIRTPLTTYLQRPYSRILAIEPSDRQQGITAARRAEQLVGLPFRPLSSIVRYEGPWQQSRGVNCVTVIKVAWRPVCPCVTSTHTPDGLVMIADDPHFCGIRVVR
jgi:hypothetical protein